MNTTQYYTQNTKNLKVSHQSQGASVEAIAQKLIAQKQS